MVVGVVQPAQGRLCLAQLAMRRNEVGIHRVTGRGEFPPPMTCASGWPAARRGRITCKAKCRVSRKGRPGVQRGSGRHGMSRAQRPRPPCVGKSNRVAAGLPCKVGSVGSMAVAVRGRAVAAHPARAEANRVPGGTVPLIPSGTGRRASRPPSEVAPRGGGCAAVLSVGRAWRRSKPPTPAGGA
jgi:hypothetical protein